ncbi:MAG TPA: hypothetical protein DCY07_06935 [Rhodospirillaceae bacterium]|nr:hypothetical protein [Rhodospirillaceae bacterium]
MKPPIHPPIIEPDKITLLGDPIPTDDSRAAKAAAFVARTEWPLCVLGGLFVAAAESVCLPSTSGAVLLAQSLLATAPYILSCTALRYVDLWYYRHGFGLVAKDKQINKSPDLTKKPADQKKMTAMAGVLQKRCVRNSSIIPLIATLVATPAVYLGVPPLIVAALAAANVVVFASREVVAHHRWSKVAKGEWIIEGRLPPPKKTPVRARRLKRRFGVFVTDLVG